jgi:fermentation-respiration switch protein FrsA (DUF1100 family)
VHTALLPPLVFGGLVIALWTWKCCMMVIFQNKIIYMPGLPPNARREKISDYKNQCGGIQWREERTRAADETNISLCVASVDSGTDIESKKKVYILYFQGNASSLPPRLPSLSPILRMLRDMPDRNVKYTIVCCSYRGYWTSNGRPSEKGIALDAVASLNWIQEDHSRHPCSLSLEKEPIKMIIWGQSIGAGVATALASQQALFSKDVSLKVLILETPFLSIKDMVDTLYPQKWLPYRYLWPFLRNHLDSWKALGDLKKTSTELHVQAPKILLLEAGKDELVPSSHSELLERRCLQLGLNARKQVIHGALHTEVIARQEGRLAVVKAILEATSTAKVEI